MNRIRFISLISIIFFLGANYFCARGPKPRQIVDTFHINKPYDLVWTSIIEIFAEGNLSVITLEKDSGIIVSEWIRLSENSSNYYDCGDYSPFPLDVVELKFNVFVKRISQDTCEIKINSLFRSGSRECVSTGEFESTIFGLVKSKIE